MNAPNDETRDKLHSMMRDAVSKLSEHFENIQLFCNNVEEGGNGTVSFQEGTGNWHARVGHARDWLTTHEEKTRAKARKDFAEDEGGDDND